MTKYIPNSYQTPNVLVDEIMPLLTPQEWVVLSYAVRHILGWQDTIESRKNCISISRFERTNLARSTILSALDQLVAFKLLEPIGDPTNKGQMWRLAFDDEPDIDGLIERKQDRALANGARTEKARGVLSDRLVSPTDHQRSVGQNGTGLSDRHNKTQDQTHLSNTDYLGGAQSAHLNEQNGSHSDVQGDESPEPKRKSSAKKKKVADVPAPADGVLDAICVLCHGTTDAWLTNASTIRQCYNKLAKVDDPITVDKLRKFYSWWYKCDWRGKKGQKPAHYDVVLQWPIAMAGNANEDKELLSTNREDDRYDEDAWR